MTNAVLPVAGAAVLTIVFFSPWFEVIKASSMLAQLVESTPERWEPLCCALKDSILSLPLAINQRDALDGLRRDFDSSNDALRVAVRSSSPEEDLDAASFAGGYEPRLGVHPADLEGAVRHCFDSILRSEERRLGKECV